MAHGRFRKLTPEQIWSVTADETARNHGLYPGIFLGLLAVGTLVGAFGSVSFPLSFGVNQFWTGIAVQQVGSIWFGGWGVLAGVLFPFFSNAAAGAEWYVSLAYIPANFLQGFLPAWVFRHYVCDPRLRSGRDYLALLAAMLISSAFGALWATWVVLQGLGLVQAGSLAAYAWSWFGGNFFAGLVFNFLLLKSFSATVIRAGLLVKRWWR